jgi:enoyl-CoA hydratase
MEYHRLLYEKVEPNILKIMINRPEKRNAIDQRCRDELRDAFISANLDDDVYVIILAGAGKDFGAGYDMSGTGEPPVDRDTIYAATGTKRTGLEKSLKYTDITCVQHGLLIRDIDKPTIAMVQGNCIASSLMYASVCDIIVASDDVRFQDPLIRWGHSAFEFYWPMNMNPRIAKEVVWTGGGMDAQVAKESGMVNHVVPREQLEEFTMDLARRIAKNLPVGCSLWKRTVNFCQDLAGQRNLQYYHLMNHEFSHGTDESLNWTRELRKVAKDGDVKARTAFRDQNVK